VRKGGIKGGERERDYGRITYPEYCFSMVLASLTFLISKLPHRVVTCDVATRLRQYMTILQLLLNV